MTDFNIFALNNVSITDSRIKEIFRLHTRGSSINWELLEKAKNIALEKFPDDAEIINKDYENEIYWTKKKLAKKGLLHERSGQAECFNETEHTSEEDESSWVWSEEGL